MAKSFIKPQKDIAKKITIQPQFKIQMADILKFGIEQFGARVAHGFYINVIIQVITIYHTAINPKTIKNFVK